MVSVLDSGSSCLACLSPGQGHCVVFLGKALYSHSTSLHLVGKVNAGVILRWTNIPFRLE